jgi:hypothetical protein
MRFCKVRQIWAGSKFVSFWVEYLGKFHLMRDLAIRCIFGAFGRKACPDATNFGKLISRLVAQQNRPQTCVLFVWPPRGTFCALNSESA